MNKKLIVCLSYALVLGSTLPVLADFACPTSCLSPVACPPCNPCRPNCLVSGCFTIDSSGQVVSQQGNGFVVASALGAAAITPGYPTPFTVTLVNPFCSQLVVIAQQSFGGTAAGTIPLNPTNLATGGSFTLNVTIPASPIGGAMGAPGNTVCFIGVPAV
jgi:hypothetical protein